MNILSIASEYFPLIKTGGLADVAGALPSALSSKGVTMRTLLPAYPAVLEKLAGELEPISHIDDLFGGSARILAHKDLLLLEAPHLFDRPGNPYLGSDGKDWPDNDQRFAALAWAGFELAIGDHAKALEGWQPDIVHCHDWQSGLVAAYLEFYNAGRPRPKTVITVHNLAFQGLFGADRLASLRLPLERFTSDGLEYYGWISFLKAGLIYSDAITTVSPTYAREIQTLEHGMGLDGVLRSRQADLTGIVNGIDEQVWDPASDPCLPKNYSQPEGKIESRRRLQEQLALEPRDDAPLFCVVSRLTRQKGLDLLLGEIETIKERGGQLAVLGSGDGDLEAAYRNAALLGGGQVACAIGYDEKLAHLMQAGSDAIIIPSRFEPCGLTQLCALRYGTIPIVSRVGGLADTVIDANPAALLDGVATGVQFIPVDRYGLHSAIDRFLTLFEDGDSFQTMRRRAMGRPVGWSHAATHYAALYRNLLS